MHALFPLPDLSWEPARPFWEAAARHELTLPRCDACGRANWYPRAECLACGGAAFTWVRSPGRGRVYSWVVVHHAFLPQYRDLIPFATGLVVLDDAPDVRLVTRFVDVDPAELQADLAVEAVFRPLEFPGIDATVTAPLFRPAGES